MHLDPNILGKWHKSFRARGKEKQRDKGNKLAITVVINNIFRQGCAALPLLTAAKLSQFLQLDSSLLLTTYAVHLLSYSAQLTSQLSSA